jgi:hypothetical protein
LATKPIIFWLCSSTMSAQVTWLATNIVATSSGAPMRTMRKPNTRSSPPDHARIRRSSSRIPPTWSPAVSGVSHSTVNGSITSTCHSSQGTRTQ